MELKIYTDGGCEPNPGKGTWAFVCTEPLHEQSGFELHTTNNRMEMLAVVRAIEYGKSLGATNLTVVSDSQYVVKGFNEWMYNWCVNDWKKGRRHDSPPVKNKDLWQKLFFLREDVKLEWTRGHNGNKYNERCDELVRIAYKEVFKGKMKH